MSMVYYVVEYEEGTEMLEKLEKIEKMKELGYNIYYSKDSNGNIEYDINLAKNKVKEKMFVTDEKGLYSVIEKKQDIEIATILRKYDYNRRAKTENAKCAVIFLPLLLESLEKRFGKEQSKPIADNWGSFLEDFTLYRVSERFGRPIEFSDLINLLDEVQSVGHMSDEYFNAVMDYIANVVLKNNI